MSEHRGGPFGVIFGGRIGLPATVRYFMFEVVRGRKWYLRDAGSDYDWAPSRYEATPLTRKQVLDNFRQLRGRGQLWGFERAP